MPRATDPLLFPQLSSTRGGITSRTRTLAFGPLSYEAGRSQLLRTLPAPGAIAIAPTDSGEDTLMGMPRCDAAPGIHALSPRSVVLVQYSWARILPFADVAAALFFDRLLELDPSLRRLFQSGLGARKKEIVQTLALVIAGLSAPAKLLPTLEALGARIVGTGEIEDHHDRIGEALLWTLREALGEDFTSAIGEAWTEAYTRVWGVMARAAADGGVKVTPEPEVLDEQAPLEWPSVELPPPIATPTALSRLGAGAGLTALCVVSSLGSTLLLGLSSRAQGEIPAATWVGVSCLIGALVFGAFRLGQRSRRG